MVERVDVGEVFRALGPTYRLAAAIVAADEQTNGMSTGVRAVLEALHVHGRQTIPEVARRLATSRQYVQRMASDAIAAGLAVTEPNPAHKRSTMLCLSAEGRTAIESTLQREADRLRAARAQLSAADVAACIRVLEALQQALWQLNGPAIGGS